MQAESAGFESQVARLTEELDAARAQLVEAQLQKAATDEVLRAISQSTADVQPVFQAIVESAARLCDAQYCFLDRFDGKLLHFVAGYGLTPEALAAIDESFPMSPGPGSTAARAIAGRTVVQIPDLRHPTTGYTGGAIVDALQVQSAVAVPMLKDGNPIGVLTLDRTEAGYFPAHQVELLKTFADQAVIAFENARLFEEVQARNREVTAAFEQQTATSEVLRVIAASPTDIQPVLQVVVESVTRFCDTNDAAIYLAEDGMLVARAHFGPIPFQLPPMPITRDWLTGRAVVDRRTLHVHDMMAEEAEYPLSQTLARQFGFHTIACTPLLRENEAIGAIAVRRDEVRSFSDKQLELLKTFADQAVIAIQNVRLFEEVQARTAELGEALQQQTATADVLKVISRSAFDLHSVLQTLIDSACKLCGSVVGGIYMLDNSGDAYRLGAHYGMTPEFVAFEAHHLNRVGRDSYVGRTALEKAVVHVPDVSKDLEYGFPELPSLGGFKAVLSVPLMREGVPIGVFSMAKPEPGPYTPRQIELVQTFADQAVIAIENVRLFDEVQARNREVSEALEQQSATGAILRAIAASPTDIQPVLQVVVESATRFCDTHDAMVYLSEGDQLALMAHFGPIPLNGLPLPINRDTVAARAYVDRQVQHVHDLQSAGEEFPLGQRLARRVGHRTIAAAPLMREGEAIGSLVIRRLELRPFGDKQIELLKTFADQAAIAIQNVRLFEEVQAKTHDLEESLTFQKATSDVLEVIGRSASTLQPVLDSIVDTAADLCLADVSGIRLLKPDGMHRAASGTRNDPVLQEYLRHHPVVPVDRSSVAGRVALERRTVHIPDVSDDLDYTFFGGTRARAILGVPLLDAGKVVGAIILMRKLAGPFSARQIGLVETFADQAVIAIKNAQLFEEVQARTAELGEALQQQTATADVLKVISRSAFDLPTVLDTLVESAVHVCEAEKGAIFQRRGDLYRFSASFGFSPDYELYALENPLSVGRGSVTGRVAREGKTIHITDVLADPEYETLGYQQLGGHRTTLGVPLLREGLTVGVFVLTRTVVKPFTDKQIELVETFADQAVIAIENVRLFNEVQARTADLEEALQQQTATADVLKAISRSTFDLDTVLQTLVESATRLCDTGPGLIFRRDGDVYRFASGQALNPEFEKLERGLELRPGRGTVVGRALLEKRVVQVADAWADPEYEHQDIARAGNLRSVLAVPLLRQGEPIGAFGFSRDRVEPFTDRQVALVQTFADQAVIAIENARLFEELQSRTEELSRSLEDLRTAQDRLIQTEKLASLGQLTAGIAHEIKNPINFVNNFSSLSTELVDELTGLLEHAPLDAKTREQADELAGLLKGNLDKVVQHGKRADSIVKNMLLHSREGSSEHRPISINGVVEESLNLAYHGARAEKKDFSITLRRDLDPAAGEVDLYPQEITRVLLNLISNGFYATTKRRMQSDAAYEPVLMASTKDLGDHVEIKIRDNGTGISPEVRGKMFTPFFTTKPAGEGTGLGLSISHDIVVKQHAGTIDIDTRPGEFTEFRIVLPRGGGRRETPKPPSQ